MPREQLRFLAAFLRQPAATGAIAPSSRVLGAMMVREMGLTESRTVVELGAGTGAFTGLIEALTPPDALRVAFEINTLLALHLAQRYPGVQVVNDSAERLPTYLGRWGRGSVDCILSGLPWAAFSAEQQERLVSYILDALPAGGRFATFAYLHAAWAPSSCRFRKLLKRGFSHVSTTPVVWRNLPPAFVYRCTR